VGSPPESNGSVGASVGKAAGGDGFVVVGSTTGSLLDVSTGGTEGA
jgi:hypothetical protein